MLPQNAPSHWLAQMYGPSLERLRPRAALSGPRTADVCIVGAGYTGLWTAVELKRAQPDLDIVILEARLAGYGASGRNGGAVIAQLNGNRRYWAQRGGGVEAANRMERAIQATVREVEQAVERENIDCGFARNGVVIAARTPLEAERLRAGIADDREHGFSDEDSRWLDADEAHARIGVEGVVGARFSPHCASIDPGRLVRGLADAAERLGVTLYEQSPVHRIEPGRAHTEHGVVTAKYVLRNTEAFTASVEGNEGRLIPIHTSMLVTEVIPDSLWRQIGWDRREALLAEHPFLHLQHTIDHRITIGGDDNRVPYKYGSATKADGPPPARVKDMYRRELVKLFPALKDVGIADSWQGVFATTRNWAPTVHLDHATGLGWAGGYVGEGVAGSNMAGRTMRDLILGRDTELTRLPWTNNLPKRRWQPEPARKVGSTLVWGMRYAGDRMEARTGSPSPLVHLGERLAGFNGHLG
jgi:glycine/D-amino acid oxidase-like deaminating enzyme